MDNNNQGKECISKCLDCRRDGELEWTWSGSGIAFTNIRQTINQQGTKDPIVGTIWSTTVPKTTLLLWWVRWNWLPTLDHLINRGLQANGKCHLYEEDIESLQHTFFKCKYSEEVIQGAMNRLLVATVLPGRGSLTLEKIASVLNRITK